MDNHCGVSESWKSRIYFSVSDIKEEVLSKFFSLCGEVQNVRVIRDSITGIGKGFGYILFKVQYRLFLSTCVQYARSVKIILTCSLYAKAKLSFD